MASRRFEFGEDKTSEGSELYSNIEERGWRPRESMDSGNLSLRVYEIDDLSLSVVVGDDKYVKSGTFIGKSRDLEEAVDIFELRDYIVGPRW